MSGGKHALYGELTPLSKIYTTGSADTSDDIGTSFATVTTTAFGTLSFTFATLADRRFRVTFTCQRWSWHNNSSEPTSQPGLDMRCDGTPFQEWFGGPQSATVASTIFYPGFSFVGVVDVPSAGIHTFTLNGQNHFAGVSYFNLYGPLLFMVEDAGPSV